MKLQLFSDVHLEFAPLELEQVDADVTICAGDIGVGPTGLNWLRKAIVDKPVIYVLGNHEFYGKAHPKLVHQLKHAALESNIHILENDELIINGVRFLGCTLWTDYNLTGDPATAEFAAMQAINDYRRIRRSPSYSKLRAVDTAVIHRQSMFWLEEKLRGKERDDKTVIVTHHAPSARSIPWEFRQHILSAAFASNLDDFVQSSDATLWVHGHLHAGCDYKLGRTRVLSNPRGYPHEPNESFFAGLKVEI